MLNVLIDSNIDTDLYSYQETPLFMDDNGVIKLKAFDSHLYSLLGSDVNDPLMRHDDDGWYSLLNFFFYKKMIVIKSNEKIHIDFSFLTKDEKEFFFYENTKRDFGFKLLVIEGESNRIHELEDYNVLINSNYGEEDYFSDPKNELYQDKLNYIQLGHVIKNNSGTFLDIDLTENLIRNTDEGYQHKYQYTYRNNTQNNKYLSFLLMARRHTRIAFEVKSCVKKEISFNFNVFTKDKIKKVPFYYMKKKSFLPYLNYEKQAQVEYGVVSLDNLHDTMSGAICNMKVADFNYSNNTDVLTEIESSDIEFSIDEPPKLHQIPYGKFIFHSPYIAYASGDKVIVKLSSPYSIYKKSYSNNTAFTVSYISEDYQLKDVNDDLIRLESVTGISNTFNDFGVPLGLKEAIESKRPMLGIACFSDLTYSKNIISFPVKEFVMIKSLEVDFSLGLVRESISGEPHSVLDAIYEDFLSRLNIETESNTIGGGFLNINLVVSSGNNIVKSIPLYLEKNIARVGGMNSLYKASYIHDDDMSFLYEYDNDLKCQVVISNKVNEMFGTELKPIIFTKILVNGVMQK